jgi:hypothetical protein
MTSGVEGKVAVAAGRQVGFVGLGNMGIPITTRLVGAGYHWLNDRTES